MVLFHTVGSVSESEELPARAITINLGGAIFGTNRRRPRRNPISCDWLTELTDTRLSAAPSTTVKPEKGDNLKLPITPKMSLTLLDVRTWKVLMPLSGVALYCSGTSTST